MPTDLPPDYKPQPAPDPANPVAPPAPAGPDSPSLPGGAPPTGPDVVAPLPGGVPAPAGLPSF